MTSKFRTTGDRADSAMRWRDPSVVAVDPTRGVIVSLDLPGSRLAR
jgi:hypothetical protein